MFKYWSSGTSLLSLSLVLAMGASSAEGLDYLDPPGEDNFYNEKCPCEEHLGSVIAEKNIVLEKATDRKFSEIENKIRTLQDDIRGKLELIDRKISDKLDENLNNNFKKLADASEDFNDEFNKLNIKINELENATLDNFHKVDATNARLQKLSDDLNKIVSTNTLNTTFNHKTSNLNRSVTSPATPPRVIDTTTSAEESQEIRWSECKTEEVFDSLGRYKWSEELRPLAEPCADRARLLRFGVRADQYAAVMLSPPKLEALVFRIVIRNTTVSMFTIYSVTNVYLEEIVETITGLSSGHTTPVYIQISEDTVEVRLNSSDSEPIMRHLDARVGTIKYYGFDTNLNKNGRATFFYDC